MALESIGKFIGPNEVVSTSIAELKTPQGKDIYEVVFKSGKKRLFSEETLQYIVTDEASDYSTVQQKKFTPVIRKVMETLAEHDIAVGEIEMFLKQLAGNIDNIFNRASNYLWFKDDAEFTPNFDVMYDVSLLMAHKVIEDLKKDAKG